MRIKIIICLAKLYKKIYNQANAVPLMAVANSKNNILPIIKF